MEKCFPKAARKAVRECFEKAVISEETKAGKGLRERILIKKGGGRFGLLSFTGTAPGDHRGACREAGRRLCGRHGRRRRTFRGHRQAAFHRQADCHRSGPGAIAAVTKRLADYPGVTVCRANFSQMEEVVRSLGVDSVDGVLMDIGVSSHQLDTPERGFSYHSDAPLDMRMSQEGPGAGDLVNSLPWQELAEILSRYGEERFSKRIAQGIAAAREQAPIETTFQLAEIVKNATPRRQDEMDIPQERPFRRCGSRSTENWTAFRGAGRRVFSAEARRTPGGDYLSFPGGPLGKAENGLLVPRLHLPAGFSGVCLRQNAQR